MGKGIEAAKQYGLSDEGARALDDMKDQLILVLINRLGGVVEIPVDEVDGTPTGLALAMQITDDRKFVFKVIQSPNNTRRPS